MKQAIVAILAFFLPFLVSSAQSQNSKTSLVALVDSLEVLMNKRHIPGMTLTIIKGDSTEFSGGLGVMDTETNAKVDENTLFRLGSITKSFVALGVLKLVKEGKFSLEDEVKVIAPEIEFENSFGADYPVKVKHLLSHTAGFDDMHLNEVYNTSDTIVYPLLKVLQQHTSSLKVRWQPGTRYSYSNPGWTVAGYLIEKYSGLPYDQFIEKNVLEPAGMVASNFNSVPDGPAYSKAYNEQGEEVPFLPIYHRPAGAFNSNANDMEKFLSICLKRGANDSVEVVAADQLDLMERPVYTLANQAGLPVGYGLGNYTYDAAFPVSFHGHDGGIDGFVSSYGYNSDHGIAYAISNNAGQGMGEFVNLIKQYLVKDIPKILPQVIAMEPSIMNEYEGYYLFKASRNQIFSFIDRLFGTCEVAVENDTLYIQKFMSDRFPVLPVANSNGQGLLFRGVNDVVPSHIFTKNAQGVPVMATSAIGNYLEKVNYGGIVTRRILLGLSLVLLLSSLVATLIWLIFAVQKSILWPEFFRRMIPSLVPIGLIMVVFGFSNILNNLSAAGEANFNGGLVYLGTWVILFSTFISTRFGIMHFKTGQKTSFSVYYLLLAFSCVMITLFLYDAGWMGLKVWEY